MANQLNTEKRKEMDPKFRDPAAIAELERTVLGITSQAAPEASN